MIDGDTWVIAPLLCLAVGAFGVYLIARLITRRNEILALCTALVFGAALACLVILTQRAGDTVPAWGNFAAGGVVLQAERGALVVSGLALGLGACIALYSGCYLALDKRYTTYYPLVLLLVLGLMGMVMTTDLFSLYLCCELMSIAAYVLVAFRRTTDTAIEAGFKYLMMGSVGTLTMLMGVALIYRETGSVALTPTGTLAPAAAGVWARAGLACLWVGLSVKSALAPVHTWLPDAHGRAPSSVSALLSGVVIQSAFYVLVKTSLSLGLPLRDVGLGLMGMAMLNMTLGNVMALVQTHVKRMLAYSTIAQMGYVMFGVGVGLRYGIPEAVQAGFFLLVAHAAMKALAFLSKGVAHFYCHTTTIAQLRGMFRRLPLPAVTLALALAGLAAIPPLAGFTGKWFLLSETLRAGDALAYGAVAVFLLNSLLALGYYLPLIATLFAPVAGEAAEKVAVSRWMLVPLVTLALLVVGMGIFPGPWWRWVEGVDGF